jgi:hypothetical protein
MIAKVGDRVVVEAERVGTAPREGEVVEVLERASGVLYRVRWPDGHESVFAPSVGSMRVLPKAVTKRPRARRRAA